jgi:hypothetical protein
LDLKSEATRFKRKIISAVIAADVKRFCSQIKTDEVFGTHRAPKYIIRDNDRAARDSRPGSEQASALVI